MSRIPEPEITAGDWRAASAFRVRLVDHLHNHPDHAGRYKAGHDFGLVSTADIRREHERQHGGEE
jgi:hypothetical protein